MTTAQCDERTEAAAYLEDLCRQIGYSVLTFAPLLERMGWAGTNGARRYLHATTPASGIFLDFLDLACSFRGAEEARERLLDVAAAWGLHPLPPASTQEGVAQ